MFNNLLLLGQGGPALQSPYGPPDPRARALAATGGLASRKSYTLGHGGSHGYRGPRNRHFSGEGRGPLDYASDTEAVQSPPRSMRNTRTPAGNSRSNSLPRTFNREALLRHPELSMELDRSAESLFDQLELQKEC